MSGSPFSIVHVNDIAFVASVLAAEQRRRGDRSDVVELPKPGASLPLPWKLVAVPLRLALAAGTIVDLNSRHPDIVQIHYATQAFIGPLLRTPFIIHCHGSDIRGVPSKSARGRYLAGIASRAALVLYSTPDLGPAARALREDARYLPNPIDTRHFKRSVEPHRDVLLGIRLHPTKGAETTLLALRRLLDSRPVTTITVIEDGPLVSRAHELLGDRARYVSPIQHADMPAMLEAHRVALGQTNISGLGQFELEAMAVGLPIVGPLPLAADPADPPPVVDGGDAESIARALEHLLTASDAVERIGTASREWVARNHDVGRVAETLAGMYAEVIAASAHGAGS